MSDYISIIKMIHKRNSPAIDWGTVPQLKSVEFIEAPLLFAEIWPLKV